MEKIDTQSSEKKSECFKTFGSGLLTAILVGLIDNLKFDKDPVKTIELDPQDPKK